MANVQPLTFSQVLKHLRRAAGLTQGELAERASLSVEGVGALERGVNRTPRRDTVALLVEALQLSPEDRALLEASARRSRTQASTASNVSALTPPVLGLPTTRRASNLPAPLTPIIGREHEEAAAVHQLRQEDVRLLTLIGAPGIGKTRLALQVAANLRDDATDSAFPDGVFLVELAPVADPTLVPAAIARALEVREAGGAGTAPLATLTAYLRTRRMLLLLDNFEQVVAAAPQVAEVLRACPGLSVLATSRIPLHVRGEHRIAVPPLALPDLGALPSTSVQELGRYPAIALFVQRAREVHPAFMLTPAQAPLVAAICHRLDGMPLAIELAAAWTRLLSPSTLLARLAQRLPLLIAGPRDLPERQQTLRNAVDWSHDLLAPAEQVLFRRLSVFVGGWTMEGAEALCGEDAADAAGPEAVLHSLASLVDTSLVDRYEEAGSEEIRFRLLELVREYALQHLEASGEAALVRERHARYYLSLVMQTSGSEKGAWVTRLARENENLKAALQWAQRHDVMAGLAAVTELWIYWSARSMLHEGRRWLEGFLELHASTLGGTAPALRAWALKSAGNLAREQGDYTRATECYEEALALARSTGKRRLIASILNNQGNISMERGDFARAAPLYEACLALREELEREIAAAQEAARGGRQVPPSQWDSLWNEMMPGEFPESAEHTVVLTTLADLTSQASASTTYNLARLALAQGDLAQATVQCEHARRVFADRGWVTNEAQARSLLGEIVAHQGDLLRARKLLEQVLPEFRAEEALWDLASALNCLGWVVRRQDDVTRALALHQESLALRRQIGDRRGIAESLEGLGMAQAIRGHEEWAVRLLGAAAAMREALSAPLFPVYRPLVERAIFDLRTNLGEELFAAIWVVAATMPLEQLLAFGM